VSDLREGIRVERPRCPYCHGDLDPGQAKHGCEACLAWHHRECWDEHGACSACGAREADAPPPARREDAALGGAPEKGAELTVPAWPPCVEAGCQRPAVWEGGLYDERCLEHARADARSDVNFGLGTALVVFGPGTVALAAYGFPAWACVLAGVTGTVTAIALAGRLQLAALAGAAPRGPDEVPRVRVDPDAARCGEDACQLPVWETGQTRCAGHARLSTVTGLTLSPVAAGLLAAAAATGLTPAGILALVVGGLLCLGIATDIADRRRLRPPERAEDLDDLDDLER